MDIKGQGYSFTLVQGHSDSTFSNLFALETAKPIEAKLHIEPPWDKGMKDCSNGPGHMTNMATIPIYGKNLKKSTSLEPKADDLENWYAASGTQVYETLWISKVKVIHWP